MILTNLQETSIPILTTKDNLLAKIMNHTAVVAVVGQGYVGLPLAVQFAEHGFPVIGLDIDLQKVKNLQAGHSHIDDVPAERVKAVLESGNYVAAHKYQTVKNADVILICVPTPLDALKKPDMSYVDAAITGIKPYLYPGQLIILESTTYPGGTEDIILPKIVEMGYQVGSDIFLSFSPERVDPGRTDYTIQTTPKVAGGLTQDCLEVTIAFYGQVIEQIVPVSSIQAAEMTKLLENTFRAVNIGLVNELALMCDQLGLNVWEIVEAASTKPYGFMSFTPGPGIGGHCIPIDPHYLAWKMQQINFPARFIEVADEINETMPNHVAGKVQQLLQSGMIENNQATVLVLGVAYKKDVGDVRESPALAVINRLKQLGINVIYHDPYVSELRNGNVYARSVDLEEGIRRADCIVLTTDHTSFDLSLIYRLGSRIVDTRNAFGKAGIHGDKLISI